MKPAAFKFILAAILALLSITVANAECLPSARAIWSAHPGAWATWRNIEGKKCWMIGERHGTYVHFAGNAKRRDRLTYLGSTIRHGIHFHDHRFSKVISKCNRTCRQLYQEFTVWLELEALYARAK